MKRVLEVDIIRPIAIILVLLTHCFAIYTGAWKAPNNIEVEYVLPFKIFTDFLQAFRMPAVVLVAGYVLVLQYERNTINDNLKQFVQKKIKRLLLPCLVFSLFYQFFFSDDFATTTKAWINLLSGSGHLWFLTMLFWNFVFGFILVKFVKNKNIFKYIIIGLFPISVLASFLPNVFGITRFVNYSVFFVYGMLLWNERDKIINGFLRVRYIVFLSFFFLLSFIFCEYFKFYNMSENNTISFTLAYVVSFLDYFNALIGVTLFYVIVLFCVEKLKCKPSKISNYLSKRSYGVYVFHQFILMFLIYNLELFKYLDYKIAPFVMFGLVFFTSLILTNVFLKTRIGRFLIG